MVVRDLFGESPEDYHSLDDFVKRAAALKLSRKVLEQVRPLCRCAHANASRDSALTLQSSRHVPAAVHLPSLECVCAAKSMPPAEDGAL